MFLSCTTLEAMKIWGELIECCHGIHGFGGKVAEIYSYRLEPYSPSVHNVAGGRNEQESMEVSMNAVLSLSSIVEEFCNTYDCKACINGIDLSKWKNAIQEEDAYLKHIGHRYHVEITK